MPHVQCKNCFHTIPPSMQTMLFDYEACESGPFGNKLLSPPHPVKQKNPRLGHKLDHFVLHVNQWTVLELHTGEKLFL